MTTHPVIFRVAAEMFMAAGAKLTYGDSPAVGSPEKVAKQAGLWAVGEELGLPFADFRQGRMVSFPDGRQNKQFLIANGVLASDGLISLPKLKSHGFTVMTGAVKNQFGCVPGLHKSEFHVKLQQVDGFARMLVDLNRLLRPRLYIMDAVWAMEGNGPRGGRPKRVNALLLSSDPVALDATACRLIGLPPEDVPAVRQGGLMGLGFWREAEIALVGDAWQELRVTGFATGWKYLFTGMESVLVRNLLASRPVIRPEKCRCCGVCVKMCPVKPAAVAWSGGNRVIPPQYNYARCIRCFCCQEVCPEKAIAIHTPLLNRLATALFRR